MGYAIEFEDCLRALEEESGDDLREYLLYTVQHGDNFETIAESLGIPVQVLAAANPGVDPATIQTEQVLISPPTEQSERIFSVIAVKLDTTADAIREANPGIDPTTLQVGEIIKLPWDDMTIDLDLADEVAVDATPADDIAALSVNEPTNIVQEMQVDSTNDRAVEDSSRLDTAAAPHKGQPHKRRPPPAELGIAPEDIGIKNSTLQDNCRMQYRDDAGSPWVDVEHGYTPMIDVSKQPEPANVQQVLINIQGIEVKQFDARYKVQRGQNGQEFVTTTLHGWLIRWKHASISDIFLSQYEAAENLWRPNAREGTMKSFCVVRFKCVGPLALCKDDTRRPIVPKGTDQRTGQDTMSSADLPLARLCKDEDALTGKEIRLAFPRGTTKGKGKRGVWVWSMIVDLLMGRGHKFSYEKTEGNKASLDTWAAGLHGGRWKSALLRKVENNGVVEWAVTKITPESQPTAGAGLSAGQQRPKRPREAESLEASTQEELDADASRARDAFAQVLIEEDTLVRKLEEVRKLKDKLRWEKEIAEGRASSKRAEGDDDRLQKKKK
ncbi:MAG: hypothetical protein Q9176_003340 [Flavoplaca citrina]